MSQGLFTAITGIRANQTKLNVVSNNIANLNTVAFKGSNVNFQTLFSQTISGGTRPNGSTGGVNPRQIGNGAAVAEIIQNFSQGGSLFTGRQGDLMLEGEGFFTLERTNVSSGGGGNSGFYLTRAGNFSLDGDGYMVSANGDHVMGTSTVEGNNSATVQPIRLQQQLTIWKERDPVTQDVVASWLDDPAVDPTVAVPPAAVAGGTVTGESVLLINYAVGTDGAITATYSNGDRVSVRTDPTSINTREVIHVTAEGFDFTASASGVDGPLGFPGVAIIDPEEMQVRLATSTNPAGLIHEGNNNFSVAPNSGDVNFGIGNSGGRAKISGGALESSNVDVAAEFTNMIIAQRGLEAAGKVITTQSEVLRTIINLI